MERKIAKKKFKILMVCLGNICRSPMAQGAMEFMAKKNSLSLIVDSAGTQNWHFNKSPDQRAQKVATSKGWKISYQKARQILSSDFNNFDLIIGMDKSNIADIVVLIAAEAIGSAPAFRIGFIIIIPIA